MRDTQQGVGRQGVVRCHASLFKAQADVEQGWIGGQPRADRNELGQPELLPHPRGVAVTGVAVELEGNRQPVRRPAQSRLDDAGALRRRAGLLETGDGMGHRTETKIVRELYEDARVQRHGGSARVVPDGKAQPAKRQPRVDSPADGSPVGKAEDPLRVQRASETVVKQPEVAQAGRGDPGDAYLGQFFHPEEPRIVARQRDPPDLGRSARIEEGRFGVVRDGHEGARHAEGSRTGVNRFECAPCRTGRRKKQQEWQYPFHLCSSSDDDRLKIRFLAPRTNSRKPARKSRVYRPNVAPPAAQSRVDTHP